MKLHNKEKILKNNQKGFALIELLVSTAILILIFGGIASFGVQVLKSYNRSRSIKNTMENVNFAIESMSRHIRTSNHIDDGGDEVFIKDNVDGSTYCYEFADGKLTEKKGDDTATKCDDITTASYELAGTDDVSVSGSFRVKETNLSRGRRGFVTINIVVEYIASALDDFNDDKIIIQTGVSSRDY